MMNLSSYFIDSVFRAFPTGRVLPKILETSASCCLCVHSRNGYKLRKFDFSKILLTVCLVFDLLPGREREREREGEKSDMFVTFSAIPCLQLQLIKLGQQ